VRQEHLQAAAGAPASGRTCSPPVVPSTCVLYFCFFSFSIVSHLQLGGRPDERCPRRLCAYINAAVCMTYACMYVYMPGDWRSSEGTMSSSLCVLFFLFFFYFPIFFYFCSIFFAPAAWRSSGCTMSSSICVRIARTVRLRDMSKCFSSKGSKGFRRGDAIRSLACRTHV
jgi:hypothetical protein